MAKIDNLNTGELGPILQRLANLERGLALASSSVERGRMRFYDGSELLIQDSNLNVVGTATIRGTLRADGTIAFTGTLTQSGPSTFTGQTNVSGDFNVTGPTKLNGKTDIGGNTTVTGDLAVKGPLDVTGTMDIKGKSTLQNDLDVKGGGKINVGSNMTLTPTANGGSVEFANQTGISGRATDLVMDGRGSVLRLGLQTLLTAGNATLTFGDTGASFETQLVRFSSRVMAPALRPAPSGAKSNLYCDPATGEIMRIA